MYVCIHILGEGGPSADVTVQAEIAGGGGHAPSSPPLAPPLHLPTVSLHTQTRPPHTHTHTWACTTCRDFGFLFLTQIVHVHECTHPCVRAHTHTHTHSLTQTGLVPLAVTLVLISHTVFTKYTVHACAHTHDTHIHGHTHTHTHTHTHKHTHTHTDWACTTCSDIGSYFSHCFHKVYMCMNCTRLCTHT